MIHDSIDTLTNGKVGLKDVIADQHVKEDIVDIFRGLNSGQKTISSRFFYDPRGSALFERITTLQEYYPTRTEKMLLGKIAGELFNPGKRTDIVELGSGDCTKISILLDAFPDARLSPVRYFPVDISEAAVKKSAFLLNERYPELQIRGMLADFMKHLDALPGEINRLVCFLGSTIGNLGRGEGEQFVARLGRLMQKGDNLLLGLDMVKDISVLEKAYNDSAGITADFNRNILQVVNRKTGTRFDPQEFEHLAYYNQEEMRVEMHLRARRDMEINSPNFPNAIVIKKGETIHTENSHKFTREHIRRFEAVSGLQAVQTRMDGHGWFSLVLFRKDRNSVTL